MTLEEMKKMQRELQGKQQDEFINKLLDMVENFVEKANKRDYEPTEHERKVFNQIHTIINNMNNWF